MAGLAPTPPVSPLDAQCSASASSAARRLRVELCVRGMTCAACSGLVERHLQSLPGVEEATVSLVLGRATVLADPALQTAEGLCEEIDDVGFEAEVESATEDSKAKVADDQMQPQPLSVELRVRGMTCAACSGVIERHLNGLPAVERATVSLILGRAFIVFDPARTTATDLCDEIDDVGFEAEVESTSSSCESHGRAQLHVQLVNGSEAGDLEDFLRSIRGVIGIRMSAARICRITYDPHIVGARCLLDQVRGQHSVEWVNAGVENEQLQTHLAEMSGLLHDLARAAPPAVFVFVATILLPSVGIPHTSLGILATPFHGVDAFSLLMFAVATPVQFCVARRFHTAAGRAMKRRSPNMDVLVSIATNVAYFYSAGLIVFCFFSPSSSTAKELTAASVHFLTMGPILIAIVLLGKYLEGRAKLTAMRLLADLPASRPDEALLCSNAKGETSIPVELVELGDVLRVFAGSKVPVDGTVCSEATLHLDESLLTGESAAVAKRYGDLILGGTTCITGGCLMRATKVGRDTTLGQMEVLVQEAQASKADIQRTADRVARVFVPTVVGLAFATFLVWAALVFGGVVSPVHHAMHNMQKHHMPHTMPVEDHAEPDELQSSLKLLFAVKFGMAVLMIACPCAMGLATPMAVLVATGVAAKRGCLVKSAAALETAARADAIVLDKTGTITQGAPAIRAAVCVAESFRQLRAKWDSAVGGKVGLLSGAPPLQIIDAGEAEAEDAAEMQRCFWWLLGTLESASDHPVAKCILSSIQAIDGLPPIVAPQDFEYISGRGVRGRLDALGGMQARVGNISFFEEHASQGVETLGGAELRSWVASNQALGQTVALLHLDGIPFGAIAVHDPVREEASWVVEYLTKQLGLEIWLCTGDNSATAQCVAREVGIKNVVAEALPGDKKECVTKLQRCGTNRRICFVGDGINDSPALAQADIGVAIGVGAQIAVEAAEVALVRAELADLVSLLVLSRRTLRTIFLNFFWAFCFNFVCLPLAAGLLYPRVHIPPLAAGIGMASSSCLVVFSSLTIQAFRPPMQEQPLRLSELFPSILTWPWSANGGAHTPLPQKDMLDEDRSFFPQILGKRGEP